MPFVKGTNIDLRVKSKDLFSTLAPIEYDGRDEKFIIPEGFVTDLASVPRLFTVAIPRYGTYTRAAILHDMLCVRSHQGLFNRHDADGIFRRVLREEGVGKVLRACLWAGVRMGGRMSDATAKEWLQVILVVLGSLTITGGGLAILYESINLILSS